MAGKQWLFDAGYVVRTGDALYAMLRAGVSEWSLLERHQCGDFGEVGAAQRYSNRRAISGRGRRLVFSSYRVRPRQPVWIITELDRDTTTVLVPGRDARAWRRARAEAVA